tara:strand:- start:487 stop:1074 length:588 start_codon:yes stop_codon:yes gene_type:complete
MKLILESWRKYLKEGLTATVPRKGKKIRTVVSEPMPIDNLLPSLFEVLIEDPETFDLVPEEVRGKSFKEIKDRAYFSEFVEEMKSEIESLLAGFSNLPVINRYLKDGYDRKNFLKFVAELPENKKRAVLKSLAVMSDKFSDAAGAVGLMVTAPNEIKLYSCLYQHGADPASISSEEFSKCREEAQVRIEEDLQDE